MTLTAEQLALRAGRIGASQAASVLGLSPYQTPLGAWLAITSRVPVEETAAMRRGTILEAGIADLYATETGAAIETCGSILYPGAEHAIIVTPDRLVGAEGLVEIKSPGPQTGRQWGESGSGAEGVPEYYLVQALLQMGATGRAWCDVAALVWGELRIYRVERDDATIADIVSALVGWHARHVVADVAPEMDASPMADEWLRRAFPRSASAMVDADDAAEAHAARIAECDAILGPVQERRDAAVNALKAAIGDAEGMRGAGWSATWKSTAKGSPKWAEIARELGASAEIIARHTGAPARQFRFSVKGAK